MRGRRRRKLLETCRYRSRAAHAEEEIRAAPRVRAGREVSSVGSDEDIVEAVPIEITRDRDGAAEGTLGPARRDLDAAPRGIGETRAGSTIEDVHVTGRGAAVTLGQGSADD